MLKTDCMNIIVSLDLFDLSVVLLQVYSSRRYSLMFKTFFGDSWHVPHCPVPQSGGAIPHLTPDDTNEIKYWIWTHLFTLTDRPRPKLCLLCAWQLALNHTWSLRWMIVFFW